MIYGLYNIPTMLSDGARLPVRQHEHEDAAFDLCASEDCWIEAGRVSYIPTGLSVEIPEGCAGLVLPRSGLSTKHNLIIPNAPGLIDPGYRGEIKVAMTRLLDADDIHAIRHNDQYESIRSYFVAAGDRIAQLLIVPAIGVTFTPAHALSESGRGVGGFGSTGV